MNSYWKAGQSALSFSLTSYVFSLPGLLLEVKHAKSGVRLFVIEMPFCLMIFKFNIQVQSDSQKIPDENSGLNSTLAM